MRPFTYWKRHLPIAAVVAATMAVGIGAATGVYAVAEAVILRALPVRDPQRLVWMWNARVERDRAPFSALDLADYRTDNTVLEGLAPFTNWTANLTGIGDAERLEGVRIAPEFFDVLGTSAQLGRTFVTADVRSQVVVLTDRLWRRLGADPSIVGQDISLNGAGHTVVGVLPPGFTFPFRDAELAVPLSVETDPRRADRGAGFLRVVARLKPGVSLTSAKANLDAIGARLRRDYPVSNAKKLGVNLFRLDQEIIGDARALLWTLLAAVTLLLFVACANIANLLLVAITSRRRELGVRAALGASRRQIASQLLSEIAVVVAVGGIAGLFVGRVLARVFVWWGGTALPRLDDVGITPGVTAFALVATVVSAVLCGVTPAWIFSRSLEVGFADDGRTSSEGATQGRFRRVFVAAQIGVALVLLVAMTLTVRSVNRLQAVNPGFSGTRVLSLQLALPPVRYASPAAIITFADKLTADLGDLPEVRATAAISLLPLSGLLSTQDYRVVGKPEPSPDEIPQAHYRIVSPRYFRVMGIPIRGREFDDTDRERTRRVAVISRTFADRHWPGAPAIGEHVLVGPDSLEIVGICEDVKQFGLDGAPTADLYVPLRQMPANQSPFVAGRMYWVVETPEDPLKAADPVRAAVRRLDKDVATSSIRPMPLVLTASVGSRRFNTDLISVAGGASLLLALIGVYSVASFSMTRRTREIGIRLTLGARPAQILVIVLAGEWKPIGLGLAVGALGGMITARALASVLFATSGAEALVISVAAASLGLAAVVASYLPARRAVRADPLSALRAP